ncbi:glycolate oxidase subunit GlcE [Methylocapsa sp. D3K7]|uniref:glycolate oxidase subunit GlcE n=1 Tax=Methylocapsa sp. D3K7 TaxID=3041435 RepID=UPI00244E5EE9|nr:glycolate oxidase subunit GlcE [Methylocapsa sp. D3K7]WGJ13456.1 glycolate oxidase subunit GlcE [Methylocapsa sp. D3K7]
MSTMSAFHPADPVEVAAFIADAAAAHSSLSITGLASKAALGRPVKTERHLDLSRLSGVLFYEPDELVISALAGTPIEDITALLAENAQELPFEPPSFADLYGTGSGTLGGCLMTNCSGPRRIKAGAVRDFVLGIKAVSGRGEVFKAGGRVVKNVTGYDLPRGLAGSFGTLAVATEITLKVLPRAETSATLILENLDPGRAVEALCAAMGAPVDVSGAAHLPLAAATAQGFATPITALRLEGFAPSVAERLDRLATQLKPFGAAERLSEDSSQTLWRAIRDVTPLARQAEKIIWKISVAPTSGPKIAEAVAHVHSTEALFDWSGGLVWLALDPCPDAAASLIRQAVAQYGGGHATLIHAPVETRAAVPIFEPQPPALAGLSRRLKDAFDPHGILEPRRMWAEF